MHKIGLLYVFSLMAMEKDLHYEIPQELILMPFYQQNKNDYSTITYDSDTQTLIYEKCRPCAHHSHCKKTITRELEIDGIQDFQSLRFAVTNQRMVVGVANKEYSADIAFLINTKTKEILMSTLTDKYIKKINLLKSRAHIANKMRKIFLLEIITAFNNDEEAQEKHRLFFLRNPLRWIGEEDI